MAEEQKPTTTPGLTPEQTAELTELSDDFFTFFSNHMRIMASPTEFRLFIGESFPTAKGSLKVTEHFCVVITPAQAKFVAVLLTNILRQLEARFGPVPSLEELTAKSSAGTSPASG